MELWIALKLNDFELLWTLLHYIQRKSISFINILCYEERCYNVLSRSTTTPISLSQTHFRFLFSCNTHFKTINICTWWWNSCRVAILSIWCQITTSRRNGRNFTLLKLSLLWKLYIIWDSFIGIVHFYLLYFNIFAKLSCYSTVIIII